MAEGKCTKKILVVIGAITAALAFIAGAVVLVKKYIDKKNIKEEYYIECDTDSEVLEESEQPTEALEEAALDE